MIHHPRDPKLRQEASSPDSFLEKVRNMPRRSRRSALRSVIAYRVALNEMDGLGYTSAEMSVELEARGVSIAAGSLRNYRAAIRQAEAALPNAGNLAPTNEQIHAWIKQEEARKRRAKGR